MTDTLIRYLEILARESEAAAEAIRDGGDVGEWLDGVKEAYGNLRAVTDGSTYPEACIECGAPPSTPCARVTTVEPCRPGPRVPIWCGVCAEWATHRAGGAARAAASAAGLGSHIADIVEYCPEAVSFRTDAGGIIKPS